MASLFFDKLSLPEKCELDKPIFKKLFLENADLDVNDKRALKDDVSKIRWAYTLKPATINIPTFVDETHEHLEVAFLEIELSSPTRAARIASFINKAIPYPLVIVLKHNDKFMVALANKRINQVDKSKLVIEEVWQTAWISENSPSEVETKFLDDCNIKKISSLNFYSFYQDLVAKVIALETATRTGNYENKAQEFVMARREALTQIAGLEREIDQLRAELKKETQFNKKVSLNMAIKSKTDAIKEIEKSL